MLVPYIHDHNLVFIHIPKNGGSSVENHFGLWKHNNHQFSCNDKKKKIAWVSLNEEPVDIPGHVLSQNYGTGDFLFSVQHYIPYLARELDRENWDKYKKFTIVRDPYTRAISEYCYRHHGEKITMFDNERFKNWFLGFCKTGYILDHYLPQVEYFNYVNYDYVIGTVLLQDELKNVLLYVDKRHDITVVDHPSIVKIETPEQLLKYYKPTDKYYNKVSEDEDYIADFWMPGFSDGYKFHKSNIDDKDTKIAKCNRLYKAGIREPEPAHSSTWYIDRSFITSIKFFNIFFVYIF